MGLVNAVYSWGSVKALHCTVFWMNLAGLLALVLAILWAVRFERGYGDYLNLITPGDGHVWATVIVSAAVLCSPAYVLGLKSWFYLKLESPRSDLEDQQRVDVTVDPHDANRLLFFHVVACLLSGFLVAILNATYLVLLSGFQQKSRDGLIEAIQKYGSDVAVKTRVDAMQTELECCGDNNYEDWFRVPWLKLSVEGPEDTEKGPQLEGQAASEDREEETSNAVDVPFSCCSSDIPKPCIHHDILSPSAVYDYDPKHLTIATLGCRSRIISRGETIRTFLAGYLALLSVYQVVLSFFSRLLQTAHSSDLYIGARKTRYHAWIFFRPDDIPAPLQRIEPSRPRSKRSKRTLLSTPNSRSSNEEETYVPNFRAPKRRRRRTSSMKVLKRLRSKISVKAKSLPLIKPSKLFAKSPSWKRNAYRSEDEDEDEEQEDQDDGASKKLLADYVTKSEVLLREEDQYSDPTSSNDSSATDLPPPPPPPPPFLMTLDLENEREDAFSQRSDAENKTRDAFRQRIFANQNSGRRAKVLEKFARIWERGDRETQSRKRGGADYPSDEQTNRSEERNAERGQLSSTDAYDRFRGTLQHTLARRDAFQVYMSPACGPETPTNVEERRSHLLAKLRCNTVPPSYRLLANVEMQTPSSRMLPSLPPPPPPPQIPKLQSSPRIVRRQRQCSVCNRPVQKSSASSESSSIDCEDAPRFPTARPEKLPQGAFPRERPRSRGDYVPCNRSGSLSKPGQRS